MKNSRLRKQVDDLETEKRRLLLAREVAQSPNEIKRAALKHNVSPSSATLAQNSGAKQPATTKDTMSATLTTSGRSAEVRSDGYTVVAASMKLPTVRPKNEREPRKEQAE